MNILLIRPVIHPKSKMQDVPFMPPLALYYLASILKEEGFGVRIIDPYEAGEKILDANFISENLEDIDVVGISTLTFQWSTAKELIEIIYGINPEIPIVIGGVHAYYFGEYILSSSKANYVVVGEGEKTLVDLIYTIKNKSSLEDIKGIFYRSQNGEIHKTAPAELLEIEELEKMPLPAYDLLPDNVYQNAVLPVETSRGCRYNCYFCSIPYRTKWRGMSPERTIERVLDAISLTGSKVPDKHVCFVDDCFTADTERAKDIFKLIKNENINRGLLVEARVNEILTPGLVDCMSSLKMTEIQIGVECGYDEGLKKVQKGITTKQVIECAEILKENGLVKKAFFSFIVGLPWETEKECLSTVHFAAELVSKYGCSANTAWWLPMPSRAWDRRSKHDIELNEDLYDDPGWMDDKELFFKIHPQIKDHNYSKVASLIKLYNSVGLNVIPNVDRALTDSKR